MRTNRKEKKRKTKQTQSPVVNLCSLQSPHLFSPSPLRTSPCDYWLSLSDPHVRTHTHARHGTAINLPCPAGWPGRRAPWSKPVVARPGAVRSDKRLAQCKSCKGPGFETRVRVAIWSKRSRQHSSSELGCVFIFPEVCLSPTGCCVRAVRVFGGHVEKSFANS